jgi:hypothetical protein
MKLLDGCERFEKDAVRSGRDVTEEIILIFYLEGLKKTIGNLNPGVPAEIRTGYFPNTSQKLI